MYKGLDITTNKVTSEEQSMVKHHLLGIIDPFEDYNIQNFQPSALRIIDDLHRNNKLPVIVGGTHYYIESVLWKILIERSYQNASSGEEKTAAISKVDDKIKVTQKENNSEELSDCVVIKKRTYSKDMKDPSLQLYKELQLVDPERASSLHFNNRRKIIE